MIIRLSSCQLSVVHIDMTQIIASLRPCTGRQPATGRRIDAVHENTDLINFDH